MSRRSRRLDWGPPQPPPSQRPLRDSLLLYAGLAVVVVVFAAVTGGSVVRGVVIAVVCFALAAGWTAWRARRRPKGERR